jgi:hypothetical protein
MCCGHRRSEWLSSQAPMRSIQRSALTEPGKTAIRPSAAAATPNSTGNSQITTSSFIKIRSVEASPLRVRGLFTGRSYEFTSSQPVQSVDTRDAASLLNTRYFRRVDSETEPS